MKEFNPEKEYKKLNRKFTKKHLLIITSVILVLAVIGISFANYSVNPNSILIIDSKVGEFSKELNLAKECDGKPIGECLANLSEDKYGEELANDNTNEKNIRYIGATPNNYVLFNGELWRIIGEFDNMWECPDDSTEVTVDTYTAKCTETKLLKLIRKDFLGNMRWDSSGANDWSNASLQKLLNSGEYWTKSGSYSTNGLTPEAQNMIARTMWNLGGTSNYITSTAEMFYTAERSDTVYQGRPTKWIGKVGLMYASDYGFATGGGNTTNREACLKKELYNWDSSSVSDCKNNDWLYKSSYVQWTLTPRSDFSFVAFYVGGTGHVRNNDYTVGYPNGVRPVVYLKSNVQITGGKGTSEEPYTLT